MSVKSYGPKVTGVGLSTGGSVNVTDGQVGNSIYVGNTAPSTPAVGDVWIDNSGGGIPSNNLVTYTATGGETSVSAVYTVGAEEVFINGIKLVRNSDYTATNGTSITGLTALVAGDVLEVISSISSTISGSIPLGTVTAAGDLIIGTGASNVSRLGIGTSGQVLVSNGTTPTWSSVDQDAMAFALMTIGA